MNNIEHGRLEISKQNHNSYLQAKIKLKGLLKLDEIINDANIEGMLGNDATELISDSISQDVNELRRLIRMYPYVFQAGDRQRFVQIDASIAILNIIINGFPQSFKSNYSYFNN